MYFVYNILRTSYSFTFFVMFWEFQTEDYYCSIYTSVPFLERWVHDRAFPPPTAHSTDRLLLWTKEGNGSPRTASNLIVTKKGKRTTNAEQNKLHCCHLMGSNNGGRISQVIR